jgi:hypothetical protein
MTLLWILLGIVYVACWVYFWPGDVPQRALLAVLDRLLLPDPVDRRRIDRTDTGRRCQGVGVLARRQTIARIQFPRLDSRTHNMTTLKGLS